MINIIDHNNNNRYDIEYIYFKKWPSKVICCFQFVNILKNVRAFRTFELFPRSLPHMPQYLRTDGKWDSQQ